MSNALDFDFESFADAAIRSIDGLRSFGTNKDSTSATESRINAFYRMIGLPAVRLGENEYKNQYGTTTENIGIYNFFKSINFSNYNKALGDREGVSTKIGAGEYKSFLIHSTDRIIDNTKNRQSGKMFPCVVNGNIGVFPQSKRIAPAFCTEDMLELESGNKMYRPLLESIINMKLNVSGASNADSTKQMLLDFNKTFNLEEGDQLKTDVWAIITVAEMFRMAITASVVSFKDMQELVGQTISRKNVNFNLLKGNIFDQNPKSTDADSNGSIDTEQQIVAEHEKTKQAFLSILDFNDISKNNSNKNVVDSSLLSSVIEVITSPNKIEKPKNDNKIKEKKQVNQLKHAVKMKDAFTGKFSGISGLDILVVITALFELELEDLYGLLNEGAIRRMNSARSLNIEYSDGKVLSSLEKLESKITSIYNWTDSQINNTKPKKKV